MNTLNSKIATLSTEMLKEVYIGLYGRKDGMVAFSAVRKELDNRLNDNQWDELLEMVGA